MSSAGPNSGEGGGGGAASVPQPYFCYQCDRTVSITPSPSSDLICPTCNGGFLEEVENPIPPPNPNPRPPNPFFSFTTESGNPGGGPAGFPFVFSTSSGGRGNAGGPVLNDLPAFLAGGFGRPSPFHDPDAFNPFLFLHNYLQTLREGGANVQFVIENSGEPAGSFRLPANLNIGDYFFGPGLEQLIQQLAENDPNRYGTPPATKSAIEGLPVIKISEELLASDSSQCAVCKDSFDLGEEAKQMPCKHIYHSDCIVPWLELHNSCPVCRYELSTDDPDYEQRSGGTSRGANAGSANAEGANASGGGGNDEGTGDNSQGSRPNERRFRVPLPWPFRVFASSAAEASNSGNGNNSGDLNPENRGNQHFGSQNREEDLD